MGSPEAFAVLEPLGWNAHLERCFDPFAAKGLEPARVAVEGKQHYELFAAGGVLTANIAGRLRHETDSTVALPKVGDWVAIKTLPAEAKAVVHGILPRRTKLSRQVPGQETQEQVLATNVDVAFLVQALDSTLNPALFQRHLVMVTEGGIQPVIVLNKADLCEFVAVKTAAVKAAAGDTPAITVSAKTGVGMNRLARFIKPGQTVVFIGPSGVGKSSLINQLYGEEIQATTEVRESDAKGRHTTSWRELIVLPGGGLVIDTPGMREFQICMAGQGVRESYRDIEELALRCHFRQCSHTTEHRCAVRDAVARGALSAERYEQFLKLRRELEYLEKVSHWKRRPDRRRARGRWDV